MEGLSGPMLFQFYMGYLFQENKFFHSADKLLEHIKSKIQTGNVSYSYSSGLVGFLWTINHLEKEKIINLNNEGFYSQFNSTLMKYTDKLILNNNYDFLHGILGIANFYFSRLAFTKEITLREIYNQEINKILKFLNNASKRYKGGNYWVTTLDPKTNEKGVNFGFAHGLPSIIVFLVKYIEFNLEYKREAKDLLLGAINFIYLGKSENGTSLYPSSICLDNEKPIFEYNSKYSESRLAWCYGDLSICYSYIIANKKIKDKIIEAEIDKIIDKTHSRIEKKTHRIIDAGLCHGAFGLFMLLSKIGKMKKCNRVNEMKDYWFDYGFSLATHKNGIAGFKSYIEGKWVNEIRLIDGASGIGLGILSKHYDLTWDEGFLF